MVLVKVVKYLRMKTDNNKLSELGFIDLSASFDTINRDILINRLQMCVLASLALF